MRNIIGLIIIFFFENKELNDTNNKQPCECIKDINEQYNWHKFCLETKD